MSIRVNDLLNCRLSPIFVQLIWKRLCVCQVSTEGTGSRGQTEHSDNSQKCADFTFCSADGSSSLFGRQFVCPHCQRSYVTKCGLKEHVDKIHKKQYRYRCETCERRFMDRSRYYDHVAAHTGVKRHTCSICEMKFMNKPSLRTHVLHLHPNDSSHIL